MYRNRKMIDKFNLKTFGFEKKFCFYYWTDTGNVTIIEWSICHHHCQKSETIDVSNVEMNSCMMSDSTKWKLIFADIIISFYENFIWFYAVVSVYIEYNFCFIFDKIRPDVITNTHTRTKKTIILECGSNNVTIENFLILMTTTIIILLYIYLWKKKDFNFFKFIFRKDSIKW